MSSSSRAITFSNEVILTRVKRTHPILLENMSNHYSNPKGFVGRNICYLVYCNSICYGSIVGGSATLHLPNRHVIIGLNHGINNIFFHIEPENSKYPIRNFTQKVLATYRKTVEIDWLEQYGDKPFWHESLVELPRTGECYRRDGWEEVGKTKGYTCKRESGISTDTYTGKRVWNTTNLRRKLVFVKYLKKYPYMK